jgi:argininosuccinate lyase
MPAGRQNREMRVPSVQKIGTSKNEHTGSSMKLWGKNTELEPRIERYTVGNDPHLDLKLVKYDCEASIAHAEMLGRIGVLKQPEVRKLVSELRNIIRLDAKGKFIIRQEDEDCHTAIENHLTKTLGDIGKKIHTARSRNDQVLAALRLYYRAELNSCDRNLVELVQALKKLKSAFGSIRLPGYTHTRKAMVSSVGLWAGGFAESFEDDRRFVRFVSEWIDQNPLGTGAGYGVPMVLDRRYTTRRLGFKKVQGNPVYVQNSRGKFESSLVHAMGQIMLDLNRAASDLILFSMQDFGYFILPDAFTTGSSIMPQKKNPDVLELVRAKTHRVIACELQLKTTTANLISGYHRDLQLTKQPVMEALEITLDSMSIMTLVFRRLKVDPQKCKQGLTEEIFATEKVYELVKQGVPFREAYQRVSKDY